MTEQISKKGGKTGGHTTWVPVKARQVAQVAQLEADAKAKTEAGLSRDGRLVWSCALCTEFDGKWDAFKLHMVEA